MNQLSNPIDFIKAGKAIFTVKNEETGNRFTYKVKKCPKKDIWFVSTLTGSDNENDYRYIGTIFGNEFRLTKKSSFNIDTPCVKVFAWLWNKLVKNTLPDIINIYHMGFCGRCGRVLTVPESIESGFGPECIKLING